MNDHPRLYLDARAIGRLREPPSSPFLARVADQLRKEAEEYARSPVFDWPRNTHNAHLLRARLQQKRVITLLAEWLRGGRAVFREAAVAHLREMAGWDGWSWIAWRQGQTAPDAVYDLSYGENAFTLAVAWDLLDGSMNSAEREILLGMARRWVVPSFLKHTAPDSPAGWFKPDAYNCNWLAVCAGGAGMAALAMTEELPEAEEMLSRADAGISNFMQSLRASGGGWPEGVSYWNYGMRYAFAYLLSWERATGRRHAAFDLPETVETLRFPLEFAPGGKTCAFGDIGITTWRPLGLHYAAAERLRADDVLDGLDAQPHDALENVWATAPEILALHPRPGRAGTAPAAAPVKLYAGIGWARMADAMPQPAFYLTIRGGHTKDSHNTADLLSWHGLVDGERLVVSTTNTEYLDTTFGHRRFDMSEMRADTKNTILIGGVGMVQPGETDTRQVVVGGFSGIRIDATRAYKIWSYDGNMVIFAGRLFLWLAGRAVLILDRVELKQTNRIETRLHTQAVLDAGPAGAFIRGEKARLQVAFAATVPCRTATATTAPTNISEIPAKVLRWGTVGLEREAVLATLIAPGAAAPAVELNPAEGGGVAVRVGIGGWSAAFCVSSRLTGDGAENA